MSLKLSNVCEKKTDNKINILVGGRKTDGCLNFFV